VIPYISTSREDIVAWAVKDKVSRWMLNQFITGSVEQSGERKINKETAMVRENAEIKLLRSRGMDMFSEAMRNQNVIHTFGAPCIGGRFVIQSMTKAVRVGKCPFLFNKSWLLFIQQNLKPFYLTKKNSHD
jgi:hypothetical protein